MKKIIEDTCQVVSVSNKQTVNAVVMDFKERDRMTVVLNKSVKLPMTWNGRVYEGRMGGLDFESAGPIVRSIQTGRG